MLIRALAYVKYGRCNRKRTSQAVMGKSLTELIGQDEKDMFRIVSEVSLRRQKAHNDM